MFLKRPPWTGLLIALMSAPALMILNAYSQVNDGNEAEVARAMWREGVVIGTFLGAGIVITVIQHFWVTISNLLARFPRSLWWGRSIMFMSLAILPFMPKNGTGHGSTASQTMAGLAVICTPILLGMTINFLQFPEDYKKMFKEMFSVE